MYDRHRVMLPPDMISGKSILDIGSQLGSTGAWCLANGASDYTGLEPQSEYVEHSNRLFQEYFPDGGWRNISSTLEEFETDQQWDIVIASGVLYACFDPFEFVKRVCKWSRGVVIFDTVHPFNGYRRLFPEASDEDRYRASGILSIIQPTERIRHGMASLGVSVRIAGSMVSPVALHLLMKNCGFSHDPDLYLQAEKEIPEYYDVRKLNRYMARYVVDDVRANLFKYAIEDPQSFETARLWNGNSTHK